MKCPAAKLDRIEEARASIAEFHQFDNEKADPAVFVNCQMRMVTESRDRERWLDAYRMAGIPV